MFDCDNTIGNVIKLSNPEAFRARSIAVLSDTDERFDCPPTPPAVVQDAINKLYLDPMPPEQVEVRRGEVLIVQLGVPINDFGHEAEIKVSLEELNFVQFDKDTRTLTIQPNQTSIGIYEIDLLLESDSIEDTRELSIRVLIMPETKGVLSQPKDSQVKLQGESSNGQTVGVDLTKGLDSETP